MAVGVAVPQEGRQRALFLILLRLPLFGLVEGGEEIGRGGLVGVV